MRSLAINLFSLKNRIRICSMKTLSTVITAISAGELLLVSYAISRTLTTRRFTNLEDLPEPSKFDRALFRFIFWWADSESRILMRVLLPLVRVQASVINLLQAGKSLRTNPTHAPIQQRVTYTNQSFNNQLQYLLLTLHLTNSGRAIPFLSRNWCSAN